jgi:hypothetical protein
MKPASSREPTNIRHHSKIKINSSGDLAAAVCVTLVLNVLNMWGLTVFDMGRVLQVA